MFLVKRKSFFIFFGQVFLIKTSLFVEILFYNMLLPAVFPPSTGITTPVTQLAALEQRYKVTPAISVSEPILPNGIEETTLSSLLYVNIWELIFDGIRPGAIALHKILSAQKELANLTVK